MPERPDLTYVVGVLEHELPRRKIIGVSLQKPVVLRLGVEGTLESAFLDCIFEKVERRAHFVHFHLKNKSKKLELVIAPMLAGVFDLCPLTQKQNGNQAMSWTLDDNRELRYLDNKQMGKVYLLPHDATDQIPGFSRIGIDVLNKKIFTLDTFIALAKKRRDQIRVFLMDKSAIDAMGNAYADEVLWEAKIHPKSWTKSLTDNDLKELHAAIIKVIGDSTKLIADRRPPLYEKLRDFMKVRNRHKEPCTRCKTPIRKANVLGYDAFFCPNCQPERRKGGIVDWRKI